MRAPNDRKQPEYDGGSSKTNDDAIFPEPETLEKCITCRGGNHLDWNEYFPKTTQPDSSHIANYVNSPLWGELCAYLETHYGVSPQIQHSICSGAPGWNVKYRKSSRALCTLYPAAGYFTAMVSIGNREAMEAELILSACTKYLQELYWSAQPCNGGRWLMIEVRSPEILEDVKRLIDLRIRKKQG